MSGKATAIVVFRKRIAGRLAAIAAIALASAAGSACAMSRPTADGVTCRVVDGAQLPAESGGADALCSAVERAVSAHAPGAQATVVVRVLSPSMLAADVTTARAGELPEQKFASSDRDLTRSSFDRFARALADAIARASR